jgi:hypothetical protein
MSRSIKGSKGGGYDYGARYAYNRHYSGGVGKIPKQMATSERRNLSKDIVKKELGSDV